MIAVSNSMARAWLGVVLVLGGTAVAAMGYADPTLIGRGARPYAYVSLVAIGLMLIVLGALLCRDR